MDDYKYNILNLRRKNIFKTSFKAMNIRVQHVNTYIVVRFCQFDKGG
jgi:hypothetical protein